jgi:hypothetical protein
MKKNQNKVSISDNVSNGRNNNGQKEGTHMRYIIAILAICTMAACGFGCSNSPTGDKSDNSLNALVNTPETCDTLDTAEDCQGIIDAWNPDWCPGGDTIPNMTLEATFVGATNAESGHLVGTVYTLALAVSGDHWTFVDPGNLPFGDFTFEVKGVPAHYSITPKSGEFSVADLEVDGGTPNTKEFDVEVDTAYLAQLQADCESDEIIPPIIGAIDQLTNGSLCAVAVEYGSETPVSGCTWRISGIETESDADRPDSCPTDALWVSKLSAEEHFVDVVCGSSGSSYGDVDIVAGETPTEFTLTLTDPIAEGVLCMKSASYAFGSNLLTWRLQAEIGRGTSGSCVVLSDEALALATLDLGDCVPTLSLLGTSTEMVDGIFPHLTVQADPDALSAVEAPYAPCTLTVTSDTDTLEVPIALVPGEVAMKK